MLRKMFRRQINPQIPVYFEIVIIEYDKLEIPFCERNLSQSSYSNLILLLEVSIWALSLLFSLTILAVGTLLDTAVMIQVLLCLMLEVFTLPLVHKSLVSKKWFLWEILADVAGTGAVVKSGVSVFSHVYTRREPRGPSSQQSIFPSDKGSSHPVSFL